MGQRVLNANEIFGPSLEWDLSWAWTPLLDAYHLPPCSSDEGKERVFALRQTMPTDSGPDSVDADLLSVEGKPTVFVMLGPCQG